MGHRSNTLGKKHATPAQIAAIDTILSRSASWHGLTSRMLRMICFALCYPIASLQSTHMWIAQFAAAMRAPDDAGVLKTFPLLADLSRRRNGVVLMLLYLASQHARVQYHRGSSATSAQPRNVRPYRVIDRAHCSATRLLTRLLGTAVGCVGQGYGSSGLIAMSVRRILRSLMGPGDPEISVHGAMRWLSIADTAAGITARRPDTLQKAHNNAKTGPLWPVVWKEARTYIGDTYYRSPRRTILSVALGIGYVLILYYWYRLGAVIAQHIAHALA